MFTANASIIKALKPISDLLFSDLLMFGRLGIVANPSKSQVMTHLKRRAAPIRVIFETLETEAELRFNSETIPYFYNRMRWSDQLPLAGYTQMVNGPLPSDVVVSLADSWALQTSLGYLTSPLLKRAALWICAESGIDSAIIWIFDILQHGFVLNSGSIARLVIDLLLGRSNVESDEEFVRRCFPNGVPSNSAAWHGEYVTFTWIQQRGLSQAAGAIVSSLIERCLTTIDQLRESKSLDEWITGQCVIFGMIWIVESIIKGTMKDIPLALKAMLSQFEEMRADAGAVYSEWIREPSYEDFLPYIQDVASAFDQLGDGTERFYRERLLVPAQLRTYVAGHTNILPTEWSRISWRLAVPWMMVSGRRNNAASLRTAPFEVSDLLGVDELRNFLSTHGVVSQKEQETVVRGEYQMPQMFRVRPENASYTDAEIADAVLTAHTTLSMREVTEGIQEAYTRIKRNESEQAIAHLTSLLNTYYAADPIFYELSLLYAQTGNYETAIEQLIPAIVLKPDQPTYWQLLANILQRLNHTVEANLAQAISHRFTT